MINSVWCVMSLNNVTVPDMYGKCARHLTLHHLKGKLFTKLDCKDAFFQMLMKEEDIPKTAITTPFGLLEWVGMPQGIWNVPAAQQCCINEALQGLTGECCEAYVNDIIIWGKDARAHYMITFSFLMGLLSYIISSTPAKSYLTPPRSHTLNSFLSDNFSPASLIPWPCQLSLHFHAQSH